MLALGDLSSMLCKFQSVCLYAWDGVCPLFTRKWHNWFRWEIFLMLYSHKKGINKLKMPNTILKQNSQGIKISKSYQSFLVLNKLIRKYKTAVCYSEGRIRCLPCNAENNLAISQKTISNTYSILQNIIQGKAEG